MIPQSTADPHFHAYYQDEVGIFSFDPVDLIAGSLPKRQRRLVEAWARVASGGVGRRLAEFAGGTQTYAYRAFEIGGHMKHAIHRVLSFEIVSRYTLCVRFEDGTEQTINFKPILAGELYGPLRDSDMFNQVRIDTDAHTLVWPNGADFDPATLHDWHEYERDFLELARRWEPVQA